MEVLKAKMQQSKDELENVREEAVMKEKMFQEEKRKREERLVKSLREKIDQDDGKLSLMEDQAASAKTLAEDSDRQVIEYLNKKIISMF